MGKQAETVEPQIINAVAETIFRAAKEGCPEAIALVRLHATHYGVGLATIVNALNSPAYYYLGRFIERRRGLFGDRARCCATARTKTPPRNVRDRALFASPGCRGDWCGESRYRRAVYPLSVNIIAARQAGFWPSIAHQMQPAQAHDAAKLQ